MIKVGIPKEIKPLEKRVGLTPSGVRELTGQGIIVYYESQAGLASGYSDEEYRRSGAVISLSTTELYQAADLIKKVKEPQKTEISHLRSRHILFSFLHLASQEQCELVKALMRSGCTAIGYETLVLNNAHPLLAPMSQIAGALGSGYAGLFRRMGFVREKKIIYPSNFIHELELIAAKYPECSGNFDMGQVVIWGAGVAGQMAMKIALPCSDKLTVVEKDVTRCNEIMKIDRTGRAVLNVIVPEELDVSELSEADIFIGCAHRVGHRAEKVLTPAVLAQTSRQKKKVIIDVAVDQGGNFPETHATTYEDPLYLDSAGNLRFSVANMPSLCGRGASEALTRASWHYTAIMARDLRKAFKDYPELAGAVNVERGQIQIEAVKTAHQL